MDGAVDLGCPCCGRLIQPEHATAQHPSLGRIHATCREGISWRGVGATSPDMHDPEDYGRGWDEYEHEAV